MGVVTLRAEPVGEATHECRSARPLRVRGSAEAQRELSSAKADHTP